MPSNNVSPVSTGMSAAFFLPLVVSLSMASPPNNQVGTTYYRESPASASKENSRLQELYLWKTVDFKYPSDAR